MTNLPGTWDTPQKILVILAHPDDPEFFCGATLARWVIEGHEIDYLLLTCGDKGGGLEYTPTELCTTRHEEQRRAAAIIGVHSVQFLSHEDGYLVPDLALRKEIVRAIRRTRPDVLVTCDPTNLFPFPGYGLNHPDHRAAGQVVLDAAFPAAGNVHYFPELIKDEGLEPHTPREVWISLTSQPSVIFDVTRTWDVRFTALMEHKSQIGDPLQFEARMRSRRTEDSTDEHPRFEEKFHVVKFRRP